MTRKLHLVYAISQRQRDRDRHMRTNPCSYDVDLESSQTMRYLHAERRGTAKAKFTVTCC